jgi:radical SAM-linked protein
MHEKLKSSEKIDPDAGRFTVRLKFKKVGNLQYISHLDLQRTFNRVIKRSGIPAWYTKGFNPHLKLVFSSPLSIGTESVCEYLDLSMQGDISCEEIMERLNHELTDELSITEAYIPTTKFADIAWAEYRCEIFTEGASEELARKAQKLFEISPLFMTKNTKSGEKEIDIVELIDEIKVSFDESASTLVIKARLSATSTQFLNPEMLISAMKRELGIMSGDPTKEWYTIMREDLLGADITRFK